MNTNEAMTYLVNKVYVVERTDHDNFDDQSDVIGVFTSLKLAEECVYKEESKDARLLPDFSYWIYDFVLNEGPKDEHQ